ncbi:MAG: DUF2286 domain-containing protein [Crenarchaeota archaeon]|nr:DUF2286 domain-containing protein [Thermoproteota archaeon]
MVREECVIVYIEGNKITKTEKVKGGLIQVVKEYAKKLIDQWDAETSDFIILRDNYTVTLKIPLKPEIADIAKKYGAKRVGDHAEITIPVYEISSSNRWIEGSFQADNFIVIFPYLTDEVTDQIANAVIRSLAEARAEEELGEEEL